MAGCCTEQKNCVAERKVDKRQQSVSTHRRYLIHFFVQLNFFDIIGIHNKYFSNINLPPGSPRYLPLSVLHPTKLIILHYQYDYVTLFYGFR